MKKGTQETFFFRNTKLSGIYFSLITYGDIRDDLKEKRISSIKIISMFPQHFVLNNLNFVLLSRKDDRKTGYQGIRY